MKLGELVVELGVIADTMKVKDFARAIGEVPLSVASAITALAGMSIGFVAMTSDVLEMTSGLQTFTAETGLNTKALQQWQTAASEVGVSKDVVGGALSSLSNIMARMRMGYGLDPRAAQAFGAFGVNLAHAGTPYDMLNKIQSGAAGMNPTIAAQFLSSLGISPEMMRVFQVPAGRREGFAPTMREGDLQAMSEFQRELADFKTTTMMEFVQILKEVEPYMGALTEALTKFVTVVGFLAVGGLKGLATAEGVYHRTPDALMAPGMVYLLDKIMSMERKIEQNVTIHNHGVQDPEEQGRATHRALTEQHKKAALVHGNGGY